MRNNIFVVPLILSLMFFFTAPLYSGELNGNQPQRSAIYELLDKIEKSVSDFETLQTGFIQEKDLAIFKNKIIIKGRIYLQKPQKIAWHVDTPMKYSILITDKFIEQWDEDTDRVMKIPLDHNPMFSVVISQLTSWFSGRYSHLVDDYNISVINKEPMEIEFIPKETLNVKKIIKSIRVTYRKDMRYLKKIHFQEVNGDSTTMIFNNTIINPAIDESVFKVKQDV